MKGKFKQLLKPSRNLLVQYMAEKKLTSVDKVWLNIFLKKYKPNKNDNVLKGNIRQIDGNCLPPYFRVLQKEILRTKFVREI